MPETITSQEIKSNGEIDEDARKKEICKELNLPEGTPWGRILTATHEKLDRELHTINKNKKTTLN